MIRHISSSNRIFLGGFALLFLLANAAFVHAQTPDRSHPPSVGPAPELNLPTIEHSELSNGLQILSVSKSDVPLVQINVIIGAGSMLDPTGKEGLAAMTADMLDEGAGVYNALDLADQFEFLGARFRVSSDIQTTTATVRVPVARLDPALELVRDVILRPNFPAEELDRLRGEQISQLVSNHDNPNVIASTLFNQTLFGKNHPFGRSMAGDEASLRALQLQDIKEFYESHYRPNNTTVVVVGDVEPEEINRKLEQFFSSWQRSEITTADPEPVSQVNGRSIYLVDKPGAAQSVIQIGSVGPPSTSPDYFVLQVVNTVLGGSFTSRLNQNLREDKGYTYGARSTFRYLPTSGFFQASANVQTSVTAPALVEFMKELQGVREPIPEEELNRAKNFLVMRYPSSFQTSSGFASQIQFLLENGLDESYFEEYRSNILDLTSTAAHDGAIRHIDPENIAIVIVGDRSVIEQSLRDLGIGPVSTLTVEDVLGPVPSSSQ